MTQDEAVKIIKSENLGKHCFEGSDVSESIIGIRNIEDLWEVYDTSERGNHMVIKRYKNKDEAIDHMIKGLRVQKRIRDRYNK